MEERKRIVVSMHDLVKMILAYFPVIICWSLFCGTILYCYKQIDRQPMYSADTSVYILSRTAESDYGRLDMSDLEVSHQMTLDAVHVFENEQTAEKVLVNLKGDAEPLRTMTAKELLNMVEISKDDDSLVVTLTVTGPDPYVVCEIANTYREVAMKELNARLSASGVETIKEALIPLEPSGRSATMYGAAGVLFGLISSTGILMMIYLIFVARRETEDVEEI